MHHNHRRLWPSIFRPRSSPGAAAKHRRALVAIAGGIGLNTLGARLRERRRGAVMQLNAARFAWLALPAALAAGTIVAPHAQAQAADEDSHAAWSARVTINLDATELGLDVGAPRSALSVAGARRGAAKLGVTRTELGGLQRLPRRAGDPAGVTHLRQTIGGLRVLWSQLDVLADDRKVTAVTGTLIPLRAKLTGAAKVRGSRAVRIARKRVAGPDTAGAPQLVAYAGDPGHPRAPRRAYVVAVDPVNTTAGDDSPMPLCVIVDAQTARVLKVWKGSVTAASSRGRAKARAAAGTAVLAQYEDAKGRTSSSSSALGNDVYDLLTNGDPFATYDTTGGFFGTHGAPAPLAAIMPGNPTWQMRAPIDGTTNVARFFCRNSPMFWCGRNGGRPGTLSPGYHRWFFTINWAGPVSKFVSSHERIYLERGDGSIDEQTHSHEIGHAIDYFSRDDYQSTDEGSEVKEALAEMFSFVYYRFRPALPGFSCSTADFMSGSKTCKLLNPATGASETVPHHYSGYGCTTDEHVNGYILGRAFLTIVQKIGFDDATRLLREVPRLLPAKRTFGSVHQAFEDATLALNMGQYKSTVHDAFIAQGVTTNKTRTGTCPNASP